MATATMRAAPAPPPTRTPLGLSTERTPPANEADLVSILRVYNDVTERLKRSHEALAGEVCRLRDELHEKNIELARRERLSALGQMAAGVAHEIRNPLGGIGLYASLLERDLSDRPKQQDIVRRISAGVRNAEHIVRDILAFAGGAPPKCEPLPLGRLLDAIVAQLTPRMVAGDVSLSVDASLRDVVIQADAGQIERALLNLVFNALDAVEGGGCVRIRGGARPGGDAVDIIVDDDGPGIPADILGRIFNPFFTTKDNGTGLGLAIVHGIAESHGGSVRAWNREGGGASFALTLPAMRTGESALSEARKDRGTNHGTPDSQEGRE